MGHVLARQALCAGRFLTTSVLTLAVLGATGAIPAAAHHPTVTEYQTGLTPNSGAWDGVDGDDGKLWFTEDALSAFGPLGAGDDVRVSRRGRPYVRLIAEELRLLAA